MCVIGNDDGPPSRVTKDIPPTLLAPTPPAPTPPGACVIESGDIRVGGRLDRDRSEGTDTSR